MPLINNIPTWEEVDMWIWDWGPIGLSAGELHLLMFIENNVNYCQGA